MLIPIIIFIGIILKQFMIHRPGLFIAIFIHCYEFIITIIFEAQIFVSAMAAGQKLATLLVHTWNRFCLVESPFFVGQTLIICPIRNIIL